MADRTDAFDAREAAQVLRQVQDLGFQAARVVVDRFVEMFDRFGAGADVLPSVGLRTDHDAYRRLQSDAQRALDSYLTVMRRMAELGPSLSGGAPAPADAERLVLPDVKPGGRTSGRLWLHNTTASAVTGLRPWVTGLMSHRGAGFPAGAITFHPDRVDHLDAGESRPLVAAVRAPAGVPAGTFHGQVLVERLPETALPVVVRVVAV